MLKHNTRTPYKHLSSFPSNTTSIVMYVHQRNSKRSSEHDSTITKYSQPTAVKYLHKCH